MPMDPGALKSAIESAVFAKMKEKFSDVAGKGNSSAEADWQKIAQAVSEAAQPIIDEIKKATIPPGIPVSGAAAGATIAPGTLS